MQKQKQQSYEPTPVDNLILQYVRDYHFLTAELLLKLHYGKGSLTRAQTKLKRLYEEGYLARRRLPHIGVGNPEYIYYLDTEGIKYLQEQGFSGFSRVRKSDIEEMKYPHLEHVLSVNEFLIAGRLLTRSVPDISLYQMQHDLDLKKTPARFPYDRRMPDGEKQEEQATIIPDAWLDFRKTQPNSEKKKRLCRVLELDRGTTSMTPFKQKLRAYVHYAKKDGIYYHQFGTNSIRVAYATTAGIERRNTMLSWCEDELAEQHFMHEASLFCFSALPEELDPKQVFCEPLWYVPYEQEPVTLLWKP